MESSSANNPSTNEFNGYVLTPRIFARLRQTLEEISGGGMPISHFSFSHSVRNGQDMWTLKFVGRGSITAVLCQSAKTAHVTASNTSQHYSAIAWVDHQSTSRPGKYLVMSMTQFMSNVERFYLKRLLKAWLRLSGGLEVDIFSARFSSAPR